MTEEITGTALLQMPDKAELPAYFASEDKMLSLLQLIESEAGKVEHDCTTAAGRKAAKSYASRVSKTKTTLDRIRKEVTEEWREKTATANAIGKIAEARLSALRDRIKKPADDYEAKEAARQQAHMLALDKFDTEQLSAHSTSVELKALIGTIDAIEIGKQWEEYEAEARENKATALDKYRADLAIAEQREAQERELDELRKDKAEREAREAKEKAERDAREAAARAEQEAKEKAEEERRRNAEAAERAAERAKEEAERKAAEERERHRQELEAAKARELEAAAVERRRIEEEKRAAAEAEAKRKADVEHRKNITREIVGAITEAGPTSYEELIDMIIDGKIPHVKVVV